MFPFLRIMATRLITLSASLVLVIRYHLILSPVVLSSPRTVISFPLLVGICSLLQSFVVLQVVQRKQLRASTDGTRFRSFAEVFANGVTRERVRALGSA